MTLVNSRLRPQQRRDLPIALSMVPCLFAPGYCTLLACINTFSRRYRGSLYPGGLRRLCIAAQRAHHSTPIAGTADRWGMKRTAPLPPLHPYSTDMSYLRREHLMRPAFEASFHGPRFHDSAGIACRTRAVDALQLRTRPERPRFSVQVDSLLCRAARGRRVYIPRLASSQTSGRASRAISPARN